MGTVRPFEQVKPFAGVLVSDERLLEQVRKRLVKLLGPIDHESEVLPFDFTDYYSEEMGDIIDRIFFSFKNLLDADSLAELKLETNRIETAFQDASGEFPGQSTSIPVTSNNPKSSSPQRRIFTTGHIWGAVSSPRSPCTSRTTPTSSSRGLIPITNRKTTRSSSSACARYIGHS